MNKRTRLIIAGGVLALLAVVVLSVYFLRGDAPPEGADEAFEAAQQHAETAPPEPEITTPAPKKMEGFQKDK